MATYTTNFNFYLPVESDGQDNGQPWTTGVNGNFTSIDAILKSHADKLVDFGPAGLSHAPGLVPDPGASSIGGRFLSEDGGWAVPSSLPWIAASMTPPVAASLFWLNQGASTYVEGPNHIYLRQPGHGGDSIAGLAESVTPGSDCTITLGFHPNAFSYGTNQYLQFGIVIRNSTTGKCYYFYLQNSAYYKLMEIGRWNTLTSWNSNKLVYDVPSAHVYFFRIKRSGDNIEFYFGDGYNFELIFSDPIINWIGDFDQVGFATNAVATNALYISAGAVFHWFVTQP